MIEDPGGDNPVPDPTFEKDPGKKKPGLDWIRIHNPGASTHILYPTPPLLPIFLPADHRPVQGKKIELHGMNRHSMFFLFQGRGRYIYIYVYMRDRNSFLL